MNKRFLACALVLAPLFAESQPLDAKAALRGYFFAGSPQHREMRGGFALCDNRPLRIKRSLPKGQLLLLAYPDEHVRFRERSGFRVLLANTTGAEVMIAASDSRLDIVREALDRSGKWRPIEYFPHSWCGNSYHHVFLPPGYAWSFRAPEYTGSFRTKMRFVLTREDGPPLYSNEFEGSINLAQFDKREGHVATNVMDPYDE